MSNTNILTKIYLKEIGKETLLNREQERSLSKRIKRYQKILIARLLDSELGREAFKETADNFLNSNLKRSDIFESFKEEENEDKTSSSLNAQCLINLCSLYKERDKRDSFKVIQNLPLSSTLLHNISMRVEPEVKDKIKEVNYRIRKAKEELITKNLKLVAHVAKDYTGKGIPYEDLIQEGNIGLMRAVDRFDYGKDTRFSTYAYWWVRQSITRSIAESSRTVRVPVYLLENFYKVNKIINLLLAENGEIPSLEEISEKTELTLDQVNKALECIKVKSSLNQPLDKNEDDSPSLQDTIEDLKTPSPEAIYDLSSLKHILENTMDDLLSPREQMILKLRFGWDNSTEETLKSIGMIYSLSAERVRQVEEESIKKLSKSLDLKTF